MASANNHLNSAFCTLKSFILLLSWVRNNECLYFSCIPLEFGLTLCLEFSRSMEYHLNFNLFQRVY